MPVINLTDLAVGKLKAPASGQTIYLDRSLKGFGVRVTAAGAKSYVLTYSKARKRVTLGTVGIVALKDARKRAKAILADYELNGANGPSLTFPEARDRFIDLHCKQKNKASTAKETERLLKNHVDFDAMLSDITADDIALVLDGMLSTPSEANHLHTALKTMFNWCMKRGYIAQNPLNSLPKPAKAQNRTRYLEAPEIAAALNLTSQSGRFGQVFELLLLTGQRYSQITQLRAEWIQDGLINWPHFMMKGSKPHTIPYGLWVQAIFDKLPQTGFLFPKDAHRPQMFYKSEKRQFENKLKLPHWTLHDLRRTMATHWARLGIAPHVTERALAHSTGVISGIAAIYNQHSYIEELRAAYDQWERFLVSLNQS